MIVGRRCLTYEICIEVVDELPYPVERSQSRSGWPLAGSDELSLSVSHDDSFSGNLTKDER